MKRITIYEQELMKSLERNGVSVGELMELLLRVRSSVAAPGLVGAAAFDAYGNRDEPLIVKVARADTALVERIDEVIAGVVEDQVHWSSPPEAME